MRGRRTEPMKDVPEHLKAPLTNLLLSIADDKLILGHRNSDWTGLGPILEEDIAFSHLAQDEMAHAQAIYEFIGRMIGKSADELAFGRPPEEFRCAPMVEVPDEFDWATAICRQFFCDHFDRLRFERLSQSSFKPLADLSRRIAAEETIHQQHSDEWMIRLGRGGGEAHERVQRALQALSPQVTWLFEPFDGLKGLVDARIYPGSDFTMYDAWLAGIRAVLAQATLSATIEIGSPDTRGGRRGVHTPHLKPLLDEMAEVYRIEPGAAW